MASPITSGLCYSPKWVCLQELARHMDSTGVDWQEDRLKVRVSWMLPALPRVARYAHQLERTGQSPVAPICSRKDPLI